MNFIICEDNERDGEKVQAIIKEYMKKCNESCKIQLVTYCFSDVVAYAENNSDAENIYFLDIIFDGCDTNGLKIAQQIREHDIYGYIVFITGYPELCMKAFQYKLKALDFIGKNEKNIKKRIFECLDTIKKEKNIQKQRNAAIVIKSGSQYHNIEFKDIIYFETATLDRKVINKLSANIEYINILPIISLEKNITDNEYNRILIATVFIFNLRNYYMLY